MLNELMSDFRGNLEPVYASSTGWIAAANDL